MTANIYKSYGVLAHEKHPYYSVSAPASDVYDIVKVEITVPTWRNVMDQLGVTLDGQDYLLSDVLTNRGDKPALAWVNDNGHHTIILNEIN